MENFTRDTFIFSHKGHSFCKSLIKIHLCHVKSEIGGLFIVLVDKSRDIEMTPWRNDPTGIVSYRMSQKKSPILEFRSTKVTAWIRMS